MPTAPHLEWRGVRLQQRGGGSGAEVAQGPLVLVGTCHQQQWRLAGLVGGSDRGARGQQLLKGREGAGVPWGCGQERQPTAVVQLGAAHGVSGFG